VKIVINTTAGGFHFSEGQEALLSAPDHLCYASCAHRTDAQLFESVEGGDKGDRDGWGSGGLHVAEIPDGSFWTIIIHDSGGESLLWSESPINWYQD
jgi:hypothetical protein